MGILKTPDRSQVLLANEHASVANLIANICVKLGFGQVQLAHNAGEAQEALRQVAFDLVLVDDNLSVPDMSQYVAGLRQIRGTERALIILLTTVMTSASATRLINAGIDAILLKPFSPEDLRTRLHLAGGQRRLAS